jgi:hypothetical protein
VKEVKEWVDDPYYTMNRETKYFKLAENYWIVKAMVAQEVEKTKKEKEDTLRKFELFCKPQYSIKFRVTPVSQNHDEQ